MQEKIEEQRVNELTESIVLKYLKKKKQSPDSMICVDIEGLASEYFKQRVIYEVFAEDDINFASKRPPARSFRATVTEF